MDNLVSKKILIVDEDSLIRRVIRLHLEREGWIGIEAENGIEALEILKNDPIALILYDIKMSGKDGVTFLKQLKEKGIPVPVIMLLGFLDMETASTVMRQGAFDFLTKPIQRERLGFVGQPGAGVSDALGGP